MLNKENRDKQVTVKGRHFICMGSWEDELEINNVAISITHFLPMLDLVKVVSYCSCVPSLSGELLSNACRSR